MLQCAVCSSGQLYFRCMVELPLNDEALKLNCSTVLENIWCTINNLLHSSYDMRMIFHSHERLYFHSPLAHENIYACFWNNSSYSWRVSETLSGVTQLRIGNVCLFICLDIRMSLCTLTLTCCFFVTLVFDPVPNFTKQNPLVIDHYLYRSRNWIV